MVGILKIRSICITPKFPGRRLLCKVVPKCNCRSKKTCNSHTNYKFLLSLKCAFKFYVVMCNVNTVTLRLRIPKHFACYKVLKVCINIERDKQSVLVWKYEDSKAIYVEFDVIINPDPCISLNTVCFVLQKLQILVKKAHKHSKQKITLE
jgi:hypothetical protein